LHSFEDAQKEQGLKEDDWVYDVFFQYFQKVDLPSIIEVNKYPPQRKFKKNSVREKMIELLPDLELIPQLSY